MMGQRGRLTLVDVVFLAAAIAVLAFLAEPFYTVFNQNAGSLGTGPSYIFQAIIPVTLLTMLSVVYVVAVGGDG